ncbi:MAG: tape measure protein [Bacillota bacterium]
MATVASFNVALIASTGRFTAAMSKAERQWDRFARNVQRSSKTLPASIRAVAPASLTMAKHVVRAAAVAGAALSALGGVGVKLAMDFEEARVAFTTFFGDARKADRFVRQLEIRGRRTPFGFAGLQESARSLLAFGYTAEQVLDMIEPLGDAVAAMGGGQDTFEQIARALGQMKAKGKVSGEELLQLAEAGVPAYQFLAEEIGTSIPQAMEMAQRGAIPVARAIDAIITGMRKRFAGAMAAQMQTNKGFLRGIRESTATIARGFGEDIIRITGLRAALQRLNQALGTFADLVSTVGFMRALERAFPPWMIPIIIGIAGAITGALVPAIVAWLIPAMRKLGVTLWASLAPLWPWMLAGAALAGIAYLLMTHWNGFRKLWQRTWLLVVAFGYWGAAGVVRGVSMILSVLSLVIPSLRETAQAVRAYADQLWAAGREAFEAALATAQGAQDLAETGNEAAEAQQGLGDALAEAARQAQDNLQSFDEVHQLQDEMAATEFEIPEVPVPAIPGLPAGGFGAGLGAITEEDTAWVDRLVEKTRNMFNAIAQFVDTARAKMQSLRDAVGEVGTYLDRVAEIGLGVTLLWSFKFLQPFWPAFATFMTAHALPVSIALGVVALLVALEWKFHLLEKFKEAFEKWKAGLELPESITVSTLTASILVTLTFALAERFWEAYVDWRAGLDVPEEVFLASIPALAWVVVSFRMLKNAVEAFREWWAEHAPDPVALAQVAQALAPIAVFAPVVLAIRGLNTWLEAFQEWWAQHAPTQETLQAWLDALNPLNLLVAIALGFKFAWDTLKGAWDAWWAQACQPITESLQKLVPTITLVLKLAFDLQLDALKRVEQAFNDLTTKVKEAWDEMLKTVGQKWEQAKVTIPETASKMAKGVQNTFEKMGTVLPATVAGMIATILMYFRGMEHEVVGGSIVPDMVNGVLSCFQNLWTEGTRIVQGFASDIAAGFDRGYDDIIASTKLFGQQTSDLTSEISAGFQSVFEDALNGLINKTQETGDIFNSVLEGMGNVVKNVLVQRLSEAASDALSTLGQWVLNVLAKVGTAILGVIQQAYATLVAFFAWSGPLAPVLAGGVIAAAIAGIAALASQLSGIVGLAQGGIVTGPTLAMMGEGGRREAVIPLERDNVIADSVGQAVYEAVLTATRVAQAGGQPAGGDREIVLRIDGVTFARAVLPAVIREGQRQGLQLVVRPQGV